MEPGMSVTPGIIAGASGGAQNDPRTIGWLQSTLVRMRDSFIRTPTRNMRYILIDEPAPLARASTPEHSTPDRDDGFPVRSQHI